MESKKAGCASTSGRTVKNKENRKVLMTASVASMIDQFNMQNIRLLQQLGYEVHAACNFREGNTCDSEISAYAENDGGLLSSMGLPEKSMVDCEGFLCVPAYAPAAGMSFFCMDTLSFSDWRRTGQNSSSSEKGEGGLYCTWISFL